VKTSLLIWKEGETVKSTGLLAYLQVIPTGVTLDLEAMFRKGRKHRISGWR